jgi:hypothetical protein
MLLHQKMELKFCINHVPFIGEKSLMFKVSIEKVKATSFYAHIQIMVHQALLMIKLINKQGDVQAKLECFWNNAQSETSWHQCSYAL